MMRLPLMSLFAPQQNARLARRGRRNAGLNLEGLEDRLSPGTFYTYNDGPSDPPSGPMPVETTPAVTLHMPVDQPFEMPTLDNELIGD